MADIVLVHGLWYRAWSLQLLKKRLRAQGHRVCCFSYPTLARTHRVNAKQLAKFCKKHCAGDFHLVGHSLGGLVILYMLAGYLDVRPGRVVLLGTPLKGSAVARRLANLPGVKVLLGRASVPLIEGAASIRDGLSVGMIAGTMARGLGRLTGPLEHPNDGTVTVSETRFGSLADHVQIPVSHTGLLFSRAVATQAAHFIAHGAFRHN